MDQIRDQTLDLTRLLTQATEVLVQALDVRPGQASRVEELIVGEEPGAVCQGGNARQKRQGEKQC